ncbi:MAG: S-methyl-5-thioribose kinase [Thermoanaerobacter sp.]|nr:S-methyl-5-thioribose kinase [Thermoanaerobacter sp.]
MSKFNKYFLMKPEDVIEYVKEKLEFFDKDADLECKEIGDGNINYIFRVWDKNSGKSVVIKQAGDTARISDEFKLSTDRNRIEAEVLQLEGKLAPGLVPVVYKYDEIMQATVMEDLSNHTIMRYALLEYKKFPLFIDHITTFLVNTLLLTSDVVLDHKEKKELVKRYINPELCEITEDLIYTEPFTNYKNRNDVYPPNLEWVKKEIYEDKELRFEVAKLKFDFMTKAQALIHGDLHTGSIFVTENSTKVIDPEFAFYGPMGFDVGKIIANIIFALVHAYITMPEGDERVDYLQWLQDTIVGIVDKFREKFIKAWKENVKEIMAKEEGFDKWYLDEVVHDAAGVTGLSLCRRIIGLAHVKDITSIENENDRLNAERICLTAAKKYIKKRNYYYTGKDFIETILESVELFLS